MGLLDTIKNVIETLDNMTKVTPKFQGYDFYSLEGIERIPVQPNNPPFEGKPIDYVLQRKATEHKKNGNMELAIACLRKSNAISDVCNCSLLEKDYLRLVKYLQSIGETELANIEKEKIYSIHPEFLDKRIITAKSVRTTINECIQKNQDLLRVHSTDGCPYCKKYHQQIYSVSGRTVKYPKVPDILLSGGECREHIMATNVFIPRDW